MPEKRFDSAQPSTTCAIVPLAIASVCRPDMHLDRKEKLLMCLFGNLFSTVILSAPPLPTFSAFLDLWLALMQRRDSSEHFQTQKRNARNQYPILMKIIRWLVLAFLGNHIRGLLPIKNNHQKDGKLFFFVSARRIKKLSKSISVNKEKL